MGSMYSSLRLREICVLRITGTACSEKENSNSPNRIQNYDRPITSLDTLPVNFWNPVEGFSFCSVTLDTTFVLTKINENYLNWYLTILVRRKNVDLNKSWKVKKNLPYSSGINDPHLNHDYYVIISKWRPSWISLKFPGACKNDLNLI